MDRQDCSDSAKTHDKEYYEDLPYCVPVYEPSENTFFHPQLLNDPDFEKKYNNYLDSCPLPSYQPSLNSFCPERFRAKPILDDPEPAPNSSLPKPKLKPKPKPKPSRKRSRLAPSLSSLSHSVPSPKRSRPSNLCV